MGPHQRSSQEAKKWRGIKRDEEVKQQRAGDHSGKSKGRHHSHTREKKKKLSAVPARRFDVHLSGCRVAASQVLSVPPAVGQRGFGDYGENRRGVKEKKVSTQQNTFHRL